MHVGGEPQVWLQGFARAQVLQVETKFVMSSAECKGETEGAARSNEGWQDQAAS